LRYAIAIFGAVLLMLMVSTSASAQRISISANSLATFSLNSDPTLPQTLSVLTDWGSLWGWASSVNVCVSMNTPLSGTGTNPDKIPQAQVQLNGVSIVTGATNCGVLGATLLGSFDVAKHVAGSQTFSKSIRISGYSKTLAPDTYTGTINLYALVL
jgi:hypothetical protein